MYKYILKSCSNQPTAQFLHYFPNSSHDNYYKAIIPKAFLQFILFKFFLGNWRQTSFNSTQANLS